MSFLSTLGGGFMQAGMGAMNNLFSAEREGLARSENYRYNEMAADNADRRTRALYRDFYSPEALMKQYRAAGLSPSIMFGGTPGQGGTAGAQGGGASGHPSTFTPISFIEGAQLAAVNAQTEKTKAETENIKKQTETIQDLNLSTIAKNYAEAGAADAAKELNRWNAELQKFNLDLQKEGKEYTLEEMAERARYLKWQATRTYEEATQAAIKTHIDQETQDNLIKYTEEQVNNLIADTWLKYIQGQAAQSQIKLNGAQIEEIRAKIDMWTKQIELQNAELDFKWANLNTEIEKFNSTMEQDLLKFGIKTQTELRTAGLQATTKIISDLLEIFTISKKRR